MDSLWIEPFGGVAGDMLLAALLDLDDERFALSDLQALANSIVPGEARLDLSEVRRGGLRARQFSLQLVEGAPQPRRGLEDLLALLERARLGQRAGAIARRALTLLAGAESRVHGVALESVHFHEVGATDTLVDVAGVALAIERLGLERVYCSPPLLGTGSVECAHGTLPVPTPAVVELLRGRAQCPGGEGERTTPTGAALLCALTEDFQLPGTFKSALVGLGAGTRDPQAGPANLLRMQLGSTQHGAGAGRSEAWLLEVNLDDMSPQEVGHALGLLRAAGALEAWSVPAQMKKDRPGAVLSALAREEQRVELERVVFTWTTSLGLRWTRLARTECERAELTVVVAGQQVRVKVRRRPLGLEGPPFGERDLFPEHDDLEQAARSGGLTLREARSLAVRAAVENL